jgi:hypothetical protein
MAELNEIAAGTMIGFSANKTVKEAKEDTATNRVDICKTKELYLNGERAGVTDVEKKFLEENLNPDSTVKASKVKTSLGSDIETYVKNNVAGAYKFQGSVNSINEILAKDCKKGDVFNVRVKFVLSGSGENDGTYEAGTNVAVREDFAAGKGSQRLLDPLGGIVNGYATKKDLETGLAKKADKAIVLPISNYVPGGKVEEIADVFGFDVNTSSDTIAAYLTGDRSFDKLFNAIQSGVKIYGQYHHYLALTELSEVGIAEVCNAKAYDWSGQIGSTQKQTYKAIEMELEGVNIVIKLSGAKYSALKSKSLRARIQDLESQLTLA